MSTLADILETKGRTVHAMGPADAVADAVRTMCTHRIGALLIGDPERPKGILSERDILARVVLENRDPSKTRIEDVMTRELVYVELTQSPEEAMRVMTDKRCRHLPVVAEGKVAGLVSIGDLVRWVSRNHEIEIQWLSDYLTGRYPG